VYKQQRKLSVVSTKKFYPTSHNAVLRFALTIAVLTEPVTTVTALATLDGTEKTVVQTPLSSNLASEFLNTETLFALN